MKANDVIRIGRSRMRAASTAASTIDRALLAQLFGELDDQDRVLRRADRSSMTSPTWQNTSLEKPRSSCALSAPNTASGTPSRMMNGSTQLSYCAASTR